MRMNISLFSFRGGGHHFFGLFCRLSLVSCFSESKSTYFCGGTGWDCMADLPFLYCKQEMP